MRLRENFENLNATQRLLLSALCATLLYFVLPNVIRPHTRLIGAWGLGTGLYLLLSYLVMRHMTGREIADTVLHHDQSRRITVASTASAGVAGLLGVIFMLEIPQGEPTGAQIAHLLLSLLAIGFSWTLIHILFTFRYARLYYVEEAQDKTGQARPPLVFPGNDMPEYFDFAYVAFAIGTAFQMPDVQVTSPAMRRLVMMHGVLSFLFNTVILALAVSIFGGLIP